MIQPKQRNKKYYDRKIRGAPLTAGDRVLTKECAFEGPHKLKDKWSQEIFVVVDRHGTLPVYKVKPESGGKTRTLHRNLLLPVQFIREPALPANKVPVPTVELPDPGVVTHLADESAPRLNNVREEDESDEEEEFVVTVPPRQRTPDTNPPQAEPAPLDIAPVPTLTPTPAPRASTRARRPPTWQTSGEFVLGPQLNMLLNILSHEGIDSQLVTNAIFHIITSAARTPFS